MNTAVDKSIIPDFDAIKAKQQAAWASGDYAVIGATLQIVGENLVEAMDVRSGQTVLDVAAGNGNTTLAAARRFCRVTSTDYVKELLNKGRQRAEAQGFNIDFQVADAEDLPFEDDQFDHVTSSFGVMFAPNQTRSAAELIRVTRPGGRIGMANWTPHSFIGELFKVIGKHVPPAAGVRSPAQWGAPVFIRENFARKTSSIQTARRNFVFRYETPQHFIDLFRSWYGPVHKAFMAAENPQDLESDLLALIRRFNIARDGTMVVPSEYLEVICTK